MLCVFEKAGGFDRRTTTLSSAYPLVYRMVLPPVVLADSLTLAQQLEQYVSLGVFVVGLTLAAFSFLAWRRERDRKMAVVAAGYSMFAVYGLVVFLEYLVLVTLLPYETVELIEHASSVLILVGLLTFFVALTRG